MRELVSGHARAPLVVLDEGLSFWGGFDPENGAVIDRAHPQHGEILTGRIVYMPRGRGSSSSSSVLAEALRIGTAPAGIVLGEPDSMIVIAVLVAKLLYGTVCPVYVGDVGEFAGPVVELGET